MIRYILIPGLLFLWALYSAQDGAQAVSKPDLIDLIGPMPLAESKGPKLPDFIVQAG